MPWNPSPEVAAAREAAKALQARAAIVIYLSDDGRRIGMASYGCDKATCKAAGELGDTLYDVAVQSVTRSRRGGDERL